jgi:hypothetical protein
LADVTSVVDQFDRWLRNEFVELNTELDEAYFAARSQVLLDDPVLDKIKQTLLLDGAKLVDQLAESGQLPESVGERYQLLGAVGYYLGACRRHEIAASEAFTGAWSLAARLGSSLGVAPRFVFGHQALYNVARRDTILTFTSLADEKHFLTNNAFGVLAYQRAANALRRIPFIGVSNILATYLFEEAKAGLDDVLRFNRQLSETVDIERFFFNVRPYFQGHRVGAMEYRGVNGGDFAAVNEIDVLLGLCSPRDPFYQHVIAEKYPYVPPEDQEQLRALMTYPSLLDAFLTEELTPGLRRNAELFLVVCRAHGAAYSFHHNRLVRPYLEEPAQSAPPETLDDITASGPPLEVVVAGLARLSDLRAARDRPGIMSARPALDQLRKLLSD